MKVIRWEEAGCVFALNAQEKALMLKLLGCFPQVPAAHHRLSRTTGLPAAAENQTLLEEAIKTHQAHDRHWLATTFQKSARFKPVENGFQLRLTRDEMERLLQAFNDVRVGSWLALKSPDLAAKKNLQITRMTAPFIQRMELAGIFEIILLRALQGGGPAK